MVVALPHVAAEGNWARVHRVQRESLFWGLVWKQKLVKLLFNKHVIKMHFPRGPENNDDAHRAAEHHCIVKVDELKLRRRRVRDNVAPLERGQ